MEAPENAVDAAARSLAARESSCFDEVHWWETLDEATRDAYPDEYPASAYEYLEKYRQQARAALRFAAPIIGAKAWEEGKRAGWIESETRTLGAHDNPYQED